MEEEKEAVFQELSENNGDCSPVLVVSSLFEQSILLSGQVFNTTLIYSKKERFRNTYWWQTQSKRNFTRTIWVHKWCKQPIFICRIFQEWVFEKW